MKKLNFKRTLLIFFISFGVAAFAQEQKENKKRDILSGGFGYFSITGQKLNLGDMNSMLQSKGYGALNQNNLSWGGGGMFAINNFLIGGEGEGFFENGSSNQYNTLSFNGGYGYLNLGYIVYSNHRSVLYPVLGIGAGGYSIDVKLKNASSNFQDQLSSPNGGSTLEGGGLLLNAQMCYQYFLHKQGKQGFFIGVKAGYRYSPSSWKMSVNGNQLSNAPNVNFNGAFVSLIIGGGNLIKKK